MPLNLRTRKILTAVLAATGIGTMWYYLQCKEACAYLTGELLGIDLKYIGIPAMVMVVIASLAGWDRLLRMGLAAAIGGEIFLFSYQVYQNIFCPYCLAFAATLILIFIVNYRPPLQIRTGWLRAAYLLGDVQVAAKGQTKTVPLSLCTLLGFLLFVLSFTGTSLPVYAADLPRPAVYGSGTTEIRIFTDYFCEPCQSMEDDAEKLLDQIIAKKKARVIFIDTPIHEKVTPMYARYFIYATFNDNRYEKAKTVRKALIAAAQEGIVTETALITYLKKKGILTPLCPTATYFKALSGYIKEDQIHGTPTCVIIGRDGKKTYSAPKAILEALADTLKKP